MRFFYLKTAVVLCLCMAMTSLHADEKVRVAFIGNSITYGAGIKNPFQNSFPALMQQFLGSDYDVRNYGISARVMLQKGDYPYMRESYYGQVKEFNPNIVFIKLGTNDSKAHNWVYGKEYEGDLETMVKELKALPAHPEIYLELPAPAFRLQYAINDSVIVHGVIPAIKRVAKRQHAKLIDLHTVLLPYPQFFPDYIHPNEEGALFIARYLYKEFTGKEAPSDYDPSQAFPGKKSQWNGYDRYDFLLNGREAVVVVPKKAITGKPWIWRPAFFGAFPKVDVALLEKGYHVAYYDVTYLYGSPRSIALGKQFYNAMVNHYKLAKKVTVEGFSRGGCFAFNWAAKYPETVSSIYLDAPVCDITTVKHDANLWKEFLTEWSLKDEDVTTDFEGNAFCKLETLAKHHIPIIGVCGDSDQIVPYELNMKKVRDAYQKMGGVVETIVKPGCNHHPHSLENPEPVVDFIMRYTPGYSEYQHIQARTGLRNAFTRFAVEKKGCVAFLGGSITEMNGWRDMIKEDLKQRFPYTDFQFVDAGISSLGSNPHAFRLETDVLQKATPDLLFVEAAVNDDTNSTGPVNTLRGMEGVVRHFLAVNPSMDIVMLHFIYDPFIPMLAKGIQPDVIMNHERVANYYGVSSINLAQEISERMSAGEFDWKYFGGTHPAWAGHKYYAASINRLFDMNTVAINDHEKMLPHEVPTQPIDSYSFDKGSFVSLSEAKQLKGFRMVDNWEPNEEVSTRPGFVNVPMLVAQKGSASFVLPFTGRAVGLFIVAGPNAGILRYKVDDGPYKTFDTYTNWSNQLYLPWICMLETELNEGEHKLYVQVEKGVRSDCIIRNFVVNK